MRCNSLRSSATKLLFQPAASRTLATCQRSGSNRGTFAIRIRRFDTFYPRERDSGRRGRFRMFWRGVGAFADDRQPLISRPPFARKSPPARTVCREGAEHQRGQRLRRPNFDIADAWIKFIIRGMPDGALSPLQFEIPPEILALSVGHLQLSERVRLALDERETIGGLIAAFELERPEWSRLVRSEISLVLNRLTRSMQYGREEGWERFRRERPKAADSTAVYFTSFRLDRLNHSVQDLPVGTLHVRTRAATALARAKIRTLGDLIHAATWGFVNPRPAGAGTCLEIIEMLDALAKAVEASGECAWDKYANSRRVILLPYHEERRFMAEDYVEEFPAVIEIAVRAGFGECGAVLTREHLLCAGQQRTPLIRIGARFGITRQKVGHVRKDVVQKLHAAFLKADYAGCRFRFRSKFVRPLRVLAAELSRARGRAIGYSEWKKILASCWLTRPSCLSPVEGGLLEILGFQLITFKQPRFRPIILPFGRKAYLIRRAVIKAERLFMCDFAAGLSKTELFDALRKEPDGSQLREADIPAILSSLPGVRRASGAEHYESLPADFEKLADRLERVLRSRGRATHFRQLASLVNQTSRPARRRSEATVVDALSADKRFTPVARTGVWSLTEWSHVETRTVAELAKVFLSRNNRPATVAELFEFISPLRKVAKNSIRTELKRNHHFLRVAPQTWALSAVPRQR